MNLEITEKKENPLLDRVDVRFKLLHDGEKTPARSVVRDQLATSLNVKKDHVIVDHMQSDFGRGITSGFAKVYKSVEKARYHERDYLLKRNELYIPPKKKEGAPEAPKEAKKPAAPRKEKK